MIPRRVLCLHGPNLNLLGAREPHIYGATSLDEVNRALVALGRELGAEVDCRQSNHEGVLIDWLQEARGAVDVLLINPGGLTHTSVSLRDAVITLGVPAFEVHVSNVYRRERFRRRSFIADVCVGRIMGFGVDGYTLALRGALDWLEREAPGRNPAERS